MSTLKLPLCLVLVWVATGCRTESATPPLAQVQRVNSGAFEVVLLAPTDELKQTRNYCTIEFRTGADHHLTDVSMLKVGTSMTMEGEAMSGVVTDPKRVDVGRYEVQMVLAMTGAWQITLDWDAAGTPHHVAFPAVVR